jgi:hypothetical protein
MPIPVAARYKMWVCDHSLAGIASSNHVGGMNLAFEWCVMSGRGLCIGLMTRPKESSRVLLSVIVKPREWVGPGSLGSVEPWGWGLGWKKEISPRDAFTSESRHIRTVLGCHDNMQVISEHSSSPCITHTLTFCQIIPSHTTSFTIQVGGK